MELQSDKQLDFLNAVEEFATNTVAKAAAGWSMGENPEASVFDQAGRLGLMGIQVPADAGGQGFAFSTKVKAAEILAGADFGLSMSLINTHNVAARLEQRAPQLILERYLPGLLSGRLKACTALTEPAAGSDFAAIKTVARQAGKQWVINGEKSWIINARAADLSIVFAHTSAENTAGDIGAFLVPLDQKGVQRFAIDSAFAQNSLGTGGFTLDEVEVPADHLILEPGPAFKTILNEINGARIYVAAMCCGMLSAALKQLASFGAKRRTFGKPLLEHQAWRFCLARAQTDLAAARALVDLAATAMDQDQETQLLAAQAKIHAVSVCEQHLPALLHAMGAEGLRPEYCLTRHLAAVQIASLTDGSTEMLLERVARLALPASNHAAQK